MILVRPAAERGHTEIDWLDSWHSFSFGDYYDTRWPGYRNLRVINDDRIQQGAGFGMHPHRDMEILTYVLSGAVQHRDDMGNGSVVRAGDVQVMSAGKGVMHSEFNASKTDPLHLLQIWITPKERGVTPSYAQRTYRALQKPGEPLLVASGDGRDDSLQIHQDADLYLGALDAGMKISFPLRPKRHAWVQVARGSMSLNGQELQAGDGAAIDGESKLDLIAKENSEALLFDLS